MKTLLIICLLLKICYADDNRIKFGWESHQIQAVLEVIEVENGIDVTESRALAEAYFRWSEGSDGGLWSMRRDGDSWVFETIVGQGTEGEDIRINAIDGTIQKKGSKSHAYPWKELLQWYRQRNEAEQKSEQSMPLKFDRAGG